MNLRSCPSKILASEKYEHAHEHISIEWLDNDFKLKIYYCHTFSACLWTSTVYWPNSGKDVTVKVTINGNVKPIWTTARGSRYQKFILKWNSSQNISNDMSLCNTQSICLLGLYFFLLTRNYGCRTFVQYVFHDILQGKLFDIFTHSFHTLSVVLGLFRINFSPISGRQTCHRP